VGADEPHHGQRPLPGVDFVNLLLGRNFILVNITKLYIHYKIIHTFQILHLYYIVILQKNATITNIKIKLILIPDGIFPSQPTNSNLLGGSRRLDH
jgi:hypothetical protein